MLELKRVSWKNFMSYGDEMSTIDLENMGQVLITGQILDESEDGLRKSNGSGKSTIPNVILWGLFGRTMHSPNPGDAIIRYGSKEDCYVKLEFKNGDYLIRTRGKHNELIFCKDQEEISLSTNKNQQGFINKQLSLDWELFTSTAFFTQYSKSWLEMADNNRKKAIERMLRVDRFGHYASAAKKGLETLDGKMQGLNQSLLMYENNITKLQNSVKKHQDNKDNYEIQKESRIKAIENSLKTEQDKLDRIVLPDLEKISKAWEAYNQVVEKIEEKESEIRNLSSKETELSIKLEDKRNKIGVWQKKDGKVCLSCLQEIPHTHIQAQIDPLIEEKEQIEANHTATKTKHTNLKSKVADIRTKLRDKRPTMTLVEAKSIVSDYKRVKAEIDRLTKLKQDTIEEINPYTDTLTDIDEQVQENRQKIAEIEKNKISHELLYKHYSYVHKAYNDRAKIKSLVFRENIPFINKRLNHYLEMLNLDIRVNLTDNLSLSSNLWGYDYQSGGERKRTDLAFMLAAFDFHEAKYGRQCNVLVLDEVDGRMDDDGIDGLINIIKQELARKVETILIISHRNQMHDVFDKEIKVLKRDNLSTLQM